MRAPKHTPGPWRWEWCAKRKSMQLCGGIPQFDLTVMDFTRSGMSGALPRFIDKSQTGMLLTRPHELPGAITAFPGREHHADWYAGFRHPDADLIAAAPDMLKALRAVAEVYGDEPCRTDHHGLCQTHHLRRNDAGEPECEAALIRAAIAKAEGRAGA